MSWNEVSTTNALIEVGSTEDSNSGTKGEM